MIKSVEFREFVSKVLEKLNKGSISYNLFSAIVPQIEKSFLQDFDKINLLELLTQFIKNLLILNKWVIHDFYSFDVKTSIIFLPAHLNHLDQMIPVYDYLSQENKNVRFLVQREDLFKILKDKRIPVSLIMIDSRISFHIKNFIQSFDVIKLLYIVLSSAKQLGITKAFNYTFKALNESFLYFELKEVARILEEKLEPDYLLVGYDQSFFCQPFIAHFKQKGILTGCIQHGNLNENLFKFSMIDEYFVWDDIDKEILGNASYNQIKIHVTGPANSIEHSTLELQENLYRDIREFVAFNPNKKIILVVFSGPGHNITESGHKKNIEIINQIAIEFQATYSFIIKLHPKDKLINYNSLIHLSNVHVCQSGLQHKNDIDWFIKTSDLIITGASTVTFEAWRRFKPVISIDAANDLDGISITTLPENCKVCNKFELQSALYNYFFNNGFWKEKMNLITLYKNRYLCFQELDPAKSIGNIIINKLV